MNDLIRTSMITFSQKIYGWGQSSFDFNSNHYFDFLKMNIQILFHKILVLKENTL